MSQRNCHGYWWYIALRQCNCQLTWCFCNPHPSVTTMASGGTLAIHQCNCQPAWYFCYPCPSVTAMGIAGTLTIHQRNCQPAWCFCNPPFNVPAVTISPFWPCFWPSTFFFLAPSSHDIQSHSARKEQKHHINQTSPLVLILQGEGTVRSTTSQPLGQPNTPEPHYPPDPPHEPRHTAEMESCEEMEE
jgi:hypothetical protein